MKNIFKNAMDISLLFLSVFVGIIKAIFAAVLFVAVLMWLIGILLAPFAAYVVLFE